MQSARLKAVSTNQRLWVRTNCPVGADAHDGVPGHRQDTAANRCSPTVFPYPAADTDIMTVPNYDGPVEYLSN